MRTVNAVNAVNTVKEPVGPSKEKQQLPALGALDQVEKTTALGKTTSLTINKIGIQKGKKNTYTTYPRTTLEIQILTKKNIQFYKEMREKKQAVINVDA